MVIKKVLDGDLVTVMGFISQTIREASSIKYIVFLDNSVMFL
jgi:hypothetical protein